MSNEAKKESTVPGPTIRGTYATYENSKDRDLVEALGHVVDLKLEGMVQIEIGGWGTTLKVKALNGANPEIIIKDGQTTVIFSRQSPSVKAILDLSNPG